MVLAPQLDISGSGKVIGLLVLTILALLVIFLLIGLVEMVVLQLLGWGKTRRAMRASLIMNGISTPAGIILILLVPRPTRAELLVGWAIAVLIEGTILMRIKPGATRQNWLAAILANLASYLLLILPAFMFR
jgi:hypothetical protein